MKIELPASELAAALTRIKGAVPNRTTLPILETVLFEAAPGGVRVTASQANMEAGAMIPCEVGEPGRAAISSGLIPIIKSLGKTSISLTVPEVMDGRAVVESARQRYEFGTLPADGFPIMQPGEVLSFEIDAPTLAAALSATAVAASDTREHLAGVCLMRDGGKLVFMATDYNRLVRYTCDLPAGADAMASQFTIPEKAIGAIRSLITGTGGPVRVGLDQHSISVATGGSRLVSRLVAGNFGDYSEFINKALAYDFGFSVARSELSEAVARMIALRAETKAPAISFSTDGEAVQLTSDRRGTNAGTEHVDAEVGAATEFAANAGWIAGLVGVWPESATLEFAAPNVGEAIRIRSASVPNLLQLLAPMKA